MFFTCLLLNLSLFDGNCPAVCGELDMSDILNKIYLDKGDVVFREGMIGDYAYIIEAGLIEISVIRNGNTVLLGKRGPDEVLGEMAIIDSQPRSATATACEPSELIIISREQFQNRLNKADPVLSMSLNVVLERFRMTLALLNRIRAESDEFDYPSYGVGTNKHQTYVAAIREIQLEREMAHALKQGEFTPFYQPIVSLETKRIVGFEALVRWNHSTKGLLPPSHFIPTAEASGFITKITRTVFHQAIRFLKTIHKEIKPKELDRPLYISINISGHDLGDESFVEQLLLSAREAGLDPRFINLEITESILFSDIESIIIRLWALQNSGFSISLDDFGTGYSSLSYLHRFPVNSLKIDRSFVKTMKDSKRNFQIVKSIIMLTKQLDLAVIAEGIEDEEQKFELGKLGCEFGQGYLFSRPVPASDARQLYLNG